MDERARLTSKGQITIPKRVRDALDLHTGDDVVFKGRALARSGGQDARLPRARGFGPGSSRQARNRLGRRDSSCSYGTRESALTAFLDTNVVIRHLTGDPPEMAARATKVLAEPGPLLLADLVVAEAYLVAQAEATGVGEVVSFDRSIDRVGTVTRREP